MWALLRTRRWLSFTAAGLVAIAAFGLLSQWQWLRAQEEETKSAVATARATSDPVALTSLVSPGSPIDPNAEWRPVQVRGSLDCDRGFLVRNRPQDGTNGLWAVCPMQTAGGAWVWVNRGWLPAPGPAAVAVPMPAGPLGEVTVTGRLRASQSGPAAVPADLPTGQVSHVDTPVLTDTAGLPGPHFLPYVEAVTMDPADPAILAPLPLPAADSAQNYSYAGQWLLFAAMTVGGWGYFLYRESRENGEAEARPAQEPQPTG